jgi:hypothetical protein
MLLILLSYLSLFLFCALKFARRRGAEDCAYGACAERVRALYHFMCVSRERIGHDRISFFLASRQAEIDESAGF